MIIPIIVSESFERLGMIKRYKSFLWHKCYYTCGDFELRMSTAEPNYDLLKIGRYIVRDDDNSVGIIEDVIITDSEDGEVATITGRFAEKFLGQRVVWEQTQVNGTVEYCLNSIVYSNFINPTDTERVIDIIGIAEPKNYTERLEAQYTGTNILELITEVCKALEIGFRFKYEQGKFYFELYKGIDRSYGQIVNPWVVFSDVNGILKEMSYRYVTSTETNVARVAGEGEGIERIFETQGTAVGIYRKELFVDARDIQSEKVDSTAEYSNLLKQRGSEKLSIPVQEVDSSITAINKYTYKKDFDLGDIITIENKRWGISINKRIIEVLESEENGYSVIVTFNDEK